MAIDEKINSRNIHKGNANDELHGFYSFVEGNKFLSQLVSFSLALCVYTIQTDTLDWTRLQAWRQHTCSSMYELRLGRRQLQVEAVAQHSRRISKNVYI